MNCETDSVTVCPGVDPLNVAVLEPVTVDALNLDIRDLVFSTDKVDVSGSTVSINEPVTVDALNLDIRDLVFSTDKVDVSGSSITASISKSGTSSQSSVSASVTNVTLLASNGGRTGATVYNDSIATLFLKLGATASSTSFTIRMGAGSYYEIPFQYTGIIDGIWSLANGAARITELGV